MSAFPTLTAIQAVPMTEETEDATIRSAFEAGYEHTRPRFTRARKTWTIRYEYMSNTDKTTLDAFVTTVRQGADSFSWTNPQDSVVYTVRFSSIPKYELVLNRDGGYWNLDFQIKQV